MRTAPRSTIEALESRIAPAGVVTVGYDSVTGVLTLTGDADPNAVTLQKTGAKTHALIGTSGTTFSPGGGDFLELGKVTAVTFLGGAGLDSFTLDSVDGLKSLDLETGADGASFNTRDLVVKGNVTVEVDGSALSGGRLQVRRERSP